MTTEERLKEIILNCKASYLDPQLDYKDDMQWLITTLSRYIKADKMCVEALLDAQLTINYVSNQYREDTNVSEELSKTRSVVREALSHRSQILGEGE